MGFVKPDYELVASGVAGLQKSVGEGGGVFLRGKRGGGTSSSETVQGWRVRSKRITSRLRLARRRERRR